jgi:hypothetical protein
MLCDRLHDFEVDYSAWNDQFSHQTKTTNSIIFVHIVGIMKSSPCRDMLRARQTSITNDLTNSGEKLSSVANAISVIRVVINEYSGSRGLVNLPQLVRVDEEGRQ